MRVLMTIAGYLCGFVVGYQMGMVDRPAEVVETPPRETGFRRLRANCYVITIDGQDVGWTTGCEEEENNE
jgi:hypothetical protein